MSEFCFGQRVRKLLKNLGNVLFYENYFEEHKINRKPLILSHNKIIMKFRPKKWESLILDKVYELCPKIKKCFFRKPTSKE